MSKWPYNTSRWQVVRRMVLERDLWRCGYCGGLILPHHTPHVDHIEPHGNDPHLAFDMDNLISCHASCHSRKTARGKEAGAVKSTKPMKGATVDGMPTDPSHPWNKKSLRAGAVGTATDKKTQLVRSGGDNG